MKINFIISNNFIIFISINKGNNLKLEKMKTLKISKIIALTVVIGVLTFVALAYPALFHNIASDLINRK